MGDLQLERTPTARIKELIANVRDIDCRNASLEEVYYHTRELINLYPVLPTDLDIVRGGVWRARKGSARKVFLNTRQLWYPLPHCVKGLGRMNAPGQSVFYCAPRRHIAGLELRPTVDDWVTVVAAEVKVPGTKLVLIPLGLERCQRPVLEYFQHVPMRDDPRFRQHIGSNTSYEKWCMIDDYFADILSEGIAVGKEDRYKRTVAVHMALSHMPIDGFMYPSIATNRAGINFCLSPASADRNLTPVACHVFELTPGEGPLELFKAGPICTSKSIDPDGKINWQSACLSTALHPPLPWWDLRRNGP